MIVDYLRELGLFEKAISLQSSKGDAAAFAALRERFNQKMDEKSRQEVLRRLNQRGVKVEDIVQSALGSGAPLYVCFSKNASQLEDPVGWYGWWPLEGIVSNERLEALEAGAEPTDGEMQSMRDQVVLSNISGDCEDLPSAHFCSLSEEFGSQVLVFLVSGHPQHGWDYFLFGLFENEERAIDALREDFFLECDID